MATEMTTGLDSCQEALMHCPWVNTACASQGTVPTHQHIRESGAALHKNPIMYKHSYRRHENSTKRQEGAGVRARKRNHGRREVVGEGDEEKKRGGGKKASHPSVPADRQWRSSLSVSLGWGSGALQRL